MESGDKDYLSVSEAAKYLGVSIQTLRRWDAEGKLRSVRHPGNSYRYYKRADLEPFRLQYQRAGLDSAALTLFETANANVEANTRLREPQREVHRHVRRHFEATTEPAIVQLPVGCGKTGVIATLPFGISKGRVLVITPNLTIRKEVADVLDITHPKCFWNKRQVLTDFSKGPFRAVLDGINANIHDCTESHFVVTNIQQLGHSADRWLPQFPPNFFDMILVDEGHHNAAPSWKKVFERFPSAKVVSLTATPFRGDGQPLVGSLVYRYSYAHAMMNGFIKQIHSINVAPGEIYFTYRGDQKHHTLDEVLLLREEAWFRKGVALSPECNRHIVAASIKQCLQMREKTGHRHQIIAAACSIDHARQVRRLYEERGLEARDIYNEMDEDEKLRVIQLLRDRRIDCVVQVQMLGEGFDHPPLSVAAVFRPFRSLSPYIQFVGRIMRVIHPDDPKHPDNQGVVVSHVGLNNEANWYDFREVDLDDQRVFHEWLAAKPVSPGGDTGSGRPRRFDEGMLVDDEIVSHFIGSSFLDPDDDRVLNTILGQKVPGTPFTVGDLKSKDELREMLRSAKPNLASDTRDIQVQPQRKRRAAKARVADRTGSVVARLLQELGLSAAGFEVSRTLTEVRGANNRTALTRLLNRAINNHTGRARADLSADQAIEALGKLDELADGIRDRFLRLRENENAGN